MFPFFNKKDTQTRMHARAHRHKRNREREKERACELASWRAGFGYIRM